MNRSALSLLVSVSLLSCGEAVVSLDEGEGDEGVALYSHLRPETRVTREGTLEALGADDFDRGEYQRQLFLLDDATGARLRITGKGLDALESLKSGDRVRVSSTLGAAEAQVDTAEDVTVLASEVVAAATMRTALTIRVNFSDSAVPCTEASLGERMYSGTKNVNAWFAENSNGAMGFSGTTVDVTIPSTVASGTCDYSLWASQADSAATAAGINLGSYQHKVYVLPSNSPCSWAGLGNLSCGSSCRAWVKRCDLTDVYAHELGHNLGLHHASTDPNNDGTIDSEYGDNSDLMGYGGVGFRHTNSPHKLQMSWIPSSKAVSAGAGSIQLAALETNSASTSLPQVLKVPKADQPGVVYHVSFRQALGSYSTNLGSYANRLSIHRQSTGSSRTMLVTTLGDGASWTDPVNGVTITQVSYDAAGATVSLQTQCVHNAPTVSLTGRAASQPGGTGAFTVTVANRDSPGCGPSTFALAATGPSGFTTALGAGTLTLDAGASGTTQLTVTSSAGLVDGTYAIAVTASEGTRQASGSGNFLIDATPPAPVSNLGASVSKSRVSLSWGVPSDGSGSGVSSYRVLRNGVAVGTTSATSYSEAAAQGTTSYSVVAIDAAGNEAAAGNVVTVTSSKRGGGRK